MRAAAGAGTGALLAIGSAPVDVLKSIAYSAQSVRGVQVVHIGRTEDIGQIDFNLEVVQPLTPLKAIIAIEHLRAQPKRSAQTAVDREARPRRVKVAELATSRLILKNGALRCTMFIPKDASIGLVRSAFNIPPVATIIRGALRSKRTPFSAMATRSRFTAFHVKLASDNKPLATHEYKRC